MTMRRLPALLLLLFASLPSLTACGSTGGRAPDVSGGARILLSDPRAGVTLGIVNDAYLISIGVEGEDEVFRRANFYSEKRGQPMTKVTGNEAVARLIQALDGEGFARYGVDGEAAGGAGGSVLEITTGGAQRHFQILPGMEAAGIKSYQACRALFMDAYNLIPQFQAADPSQIRLETPGIRR